MSTLTGAVLIALGKEFAGIMSNSDELLRKFEENSGLNGEKVWKLPSS